MIHLKSGRFFFNKSTRAIKTGQEVALPFLNKIVVLHYTPLEIGFLSESHFFRTLREKVFTGEGSYIYQGREILAVPVCSLW